MTGSETTEIEFLTLFGEPVKGFKGIAGKTDQVFFVE
jgi:hypothetical protein